MNRGMLEFVDRGDASERINICHHQRLARGGGILSWAAVIIAMGGREDEGEVKGWKGNYKLRRARKRERMGNSQRRGR
jgi:hypothetical protein